ncbi:Tripartite ATP-independent periplasmic transporters, DctQ component [Pseudoruegeria aquimaris]|uniref:TRAP transporter small permease protein n=1 Tax=Pseudoruegeria aquimaris TaxID=393663 RepID=A0A1Y5S6A6_9RHOB|nr:TRAP transporter small permease subunit [Pseudoruegeria aquimaris]SLN33506.1 Tripartite ATP-independent periplasmic transporters, DctQ component [Pseudoruegeria aquimaris]
MALLFGLLTPLQLVNDFVLRIGRWIGVVAVALMVVAILLQVFFRYVLNNALPWPDEAARFLMLWMTGLVAPSAYRQGGFVAIDMLEQALPKRAGALLGLFLLVVSLAVLIVGAQFGYKHVNSGWLFASSTLKLPLGLIGGETVKIKLAWMYMSLFVGLILLIAVNIELILRDLITLLGGGSELRPIPVAFAGAD